MPTIIKSNTVRFIAVAAASIAFTQLASAQTTQTQQPNQTQHMGGGTQPGPGTHGHSSSPKAGETQQLQQQQHSMPATPSHSGGPSTGKSNQ